MLKNDTKGVPCASKSDAKGSWPSDPDHLSLTAWTFVQAIDGLI